jgi:aminoglycoside 6-adenylyltransferase
VVPGERRVVTDPVISRLIEWAGARDSVRAMILTSTRAAPDASPDPFSDYDVVVVVTDVAPYYEDRSWLEDFGKVLVSYQDPLKERPGGRTFAYITQYEDGLKIDFTLWPVEVLARLADEAELPCDLDVGYAVLVDKDRLSEGLAPPSYEAYVPDPPSEETYRKLVESFFHEATYVAKHLWRGDLLPMKYNLDHAMKQRDLRTMLEWRMEIDHDWSARPRAYGSRLGQSLPREIWSELERTYVGAGVDENWDALSRTVALFRRVAIDVADSLGVEYPRDLDRRVCRYLGEVKEKRAG